MTYNSHIDNKKKRGDYITLQERKKEINEINEKLAVIGNKELLIVHTTATALYLKQQLDEYEQPLQPTAQAPPEKPRQISILEYGGAKIT